MILSDPVRIYPMTNGRILTAAADAVRLPDHIMKQFADLAEFGRRIASEVATARADRRRAFKAAIGLLKRRHQAMTDGLGSSDIERIASEVANTLAAEAERTGPNDRRQYCQRTKPIAQHLGALVMAAHAPPAFSAHKTTTRRVLML